MYKRITLSLIILHTIVWVSVSYNTLYTVELAPTEIVAPSKALPPKFKHWQHHPDLWTYYSPVWDNKAHVLSKLYTYIKGINPHV